MEELQPGKVRYYIYVLKLMDGGYYTGATKDLIRDLYSEISGAGSVFTRENRPVMLMEVIVCNSEDANDAREAVAWSIRKGRDEFYLPPELNELFYRIVAMASDRDISKPIEFSEDRLRDCLEFIEMPKVAEWGDT